MPRGARARSCSRHGHLAATGRGQVLGPQRDGGHRPHPREGCLASPSTAPRARGEPCGHRRRVSEAGGRAGGEARGHRQGPASPVSRGCEGAEVCFAFRKDRALLPLGWGLVGGPAPGAGIGRGAPSCFGPGSPRGDWLRRRVLPAGRCVAAPHSPGARRPAAAWGTEKVLAGRTERTTAVLMGAWKASLFSPFLLRSHSRGVRLMFLLLTLHLGNW